MGTVDRSSASGGADRRLAATLAAALACVVMGWFAFTGEGRVPLLGMFDLGIHELGHMLAMSMPRMIHFIAGSFLQVAVPAGLAVYFLKWRREPVSGALMLAWTGTSLRDVSIYLADAPYQRLPLLYPNSQHDWAYLLGPNGFDAIESTATIARVLDVTSLSLICAGLGLLAWHAWPRAVPPPPGIRRTPAVAGDPFAAHPLPGGEPGIETGAD